MNFRKLCCAVAIAVLGLGAVLYRVETVYGCGPYFDTAYFTFSLHPDFPLEPYARGELGVLQPTYARSYLYVAYRYLSGKSFDAGEQKALVALWSERLAPFSLGSPQNDAGSKDSWIEQWIEARKKVPGAGPDPSIDAYRDFGKYYQQYINCTDDGFRTAISTLNQRIARFGGDSKTVEDWVRAQDQVFSNCSHKPPGFQPGKDSPSLVETIPVALQSGVEPLARADREYQIAAAYFYAADFDEAGKRFQTIARDANSPWRQVSRLLVARCLIRKATLSTDNDTFDEAPLVQAESQLNQILGDRGVAELQPSAQRLRDFVEIRLHPRETGRHLAARLQQEHVGSTLKQNLWDYTVLMDKAPPVEGTGNAKATAGKQEKGSPEANELRAGDDLTDWLDSFQNAAPLGLDHSLERWTQTRSLPWLVASLSKVHAGQKAVPQLLKAAENVAPGSPAFATVAFHRLRLLSEANQNDEVRISLDKLLSQRNRALPPSSLNLFLALRMKVASNLEELLRFAQRVPATVTMDEEGMELPDDAETPPGPNKSRVKEQVRLDADSAEILNKMLPLDILAQAAESKTLPDDLRRLVARAAWVRSILLGDINVSTQMARVLESLDPALRDGLEAYRAEKSIEAGRFAAVFLMLKYPGTRPILDTGVSRETALNKIDNYRDNWWCVPEETGKRDPAEAAQFAPHPLSKPLRALYPEGKPAAPAFLDAGQKTKGQEDWKELQHLGVAPNYFAQEVLAWGKQHPDDPRVPEALSLAVRSTRYGCTDKATGGLSKAAFELLHGQYPKTEWAKKTRYWYGGEGNADR